MKGLLTLTIKPVHTVTFLMDTFINQNQELNSDMRQIVLRFHHHKIIAVASKYLTNDEGDFT
jgi:hypothetical protein